VTTSPVRLPEVGAELDLIVGEVAAGGWCVARRDEAGPVIFVRHALPGERVRAVVTQTTSRLARADAVEILAPSADRVAPPCPHARPGGCGGCDWQHAALPAQRALKAEVIRQQLRQMAGIEREVTVEPLGSAGADAPAGGDGGAAGTSEDGQAGADGLGWRTRVRFAVRSDGVAGLRRHRSHQVVDVGTCPIAHPLVNAAQVTRRRWPGARSVEVAVSAGTGDRAVIVTGPPGRRWDSAGRSRAGAERTADTEPAMDAEPGTDSAPAADSRTAGHSVSAADSVPASESLLATGRGGRIAPQRGRGYLTERAAGRQWRVGAGTFWQVHPAAADTLAAAVLSALRPQPGDRALDLYCGAGLFAGVVAEAVGPQGAVVGIEENAAAVRDARHNLRATPWARVHKGDVTAVLARDGRSGASLAVLDPPRTGAARPVIDVLCGPSGGGADTGPGGALRRIAYVSCDPATLARDLALFAESGWQLEALRAFDAFPMTHHVECLATLVPVPARR
jgi:tRNA/tmRNA/rRNA uracil-C5-methylase (TrmA/RlmC/RlmD family)